MGARHVVNGTNWGHLVIWEGFDHVFVAAWVCEGVDGIRDIGLMVGLDIAVFEKVTVEWLVEEVRGGGVLLVGEEVELWLFVCVLHDGGEDRERGLTDYNYNWTFKNN